MTLSMTHGKLVRTILHLVATILGLQFQYKDCLAQVGAYGQFAPEDAYLDGSSLPYYGSENEWSRRQFSAEKAEIEYKRRGQRQLLATLDGNPKQALQWAEKRLQDDPTDLESMFNQVVAYTQLAQLDRAIETAKHAVEEGMPIERFFAGPRHLLKQLIDSEEFEQFADSQDASPLLHGPMLGAVTDHSARVWIRTAEEKPAQVNVYRCDDKGEPTDQLVFTSRAISSSADDFTATLKLEGLEPDTSYAYEVIIDGKTHNNGTKYLLKTFPAAGSANKFRIAFGGCAGYAPEHERVWDTILSFEPSAVFLLGDNVYIDLPEEPRGLHQYTYYQRHSRPEFRRLVSASPVYAIWDDHDCAMDDVWLGPYPDKPKWKPAMLTVFKQNWVNPAYGSPEKPGCWFSMSLGDVDFFFLDTRYWRTNPNGEEPTMLGSVQKEWLREQLLASKATFKVIASSVPWDPDAKPESRDTWGGFLDERNEIFGWIRDHQIDGVLLLSADRHRSEAWKINHEGIYPLYDLMSARLTNTHTHACVPGALFCYNEKCSFGLVHFDTSSDNPSVVYEIVNIEGEVVYTLEISLSALSFRK